MGQVLYVYDLAEDGARQLTWRLQLRPSPIDGTLWLLNGDDDDDCTGTLTTWSDRWDPILSEFTL